MLNKCTIYSKMLKKLTILSLRIMVDLIDDLWFSIVIFYDHAREDIRKNKAKFIKSLK